MTVIDEVDPDKLIPPSRRFDTVCRRAVARADASEQPHRFYRVFEEQLVRIRREGLDEALETWPVWRDPVYLAAEIEALAATRFMITMSAAMAETETA